MIAPNFERQWTTPEPEQDKPEILPIHKSILADMDNHVWIELPEPTSESSPSTTGLSERVEPETVESRREQNRLRREQLLTELRATADVPPEPPIESDREPYPPSPSNRASGRRYETAGAVERYRRCPACRGSGKRWFVLICPRCGGLGSVKADR